MRFWITLSIYEVPDNPPDPSIYLGSANESLKTQRRSKEIISYRIFIIEVKTVKVIPGGSNLILDNFFHNLHDDLPHSINLQPHMKVSILVFSNIVTSSR